MINLGPAIQIQKAMHTGQFTAHQSLPFHHGTWLPALHVIDGGDHGSSYRGKLTLLSFLTQWT